MQGTDIVFVGDFNVYSKGMARLAAMRGLGARVEAVEHTPMGGDEIGAPRPGLAFRIGWKLGVHLDTENASRRMLAAVAALRPQLLWIEKGNMIRPAALAAVRRLSPLTRIASYSDDDMFAGHNRRRAYTAGLGHYDLVFVTKSYNAEPGELPALGARRVVMVDKAYDPDAHFPIAVDAEEAHALGAGVGFIGTFEEERANLMLFLAENGIGVRVWGNGWERWRGRHPLLRVEGRPLVNTAGNLLYTKGICATRINLGFLRRINRDQQTDRSIEIPACGGFMLAERSAEHLRLFAEGAEAEFFDSPAELLAKTRRYLADPGACGAIGAAGRARCLQGGYGQPERVRFMLQCALAHDPGRT